MSLSVAQVTVVTKKNEEKKHQCYCPEKCRQVIRILLIFQDWASLINSMLISFWEASESGGVPCGQPECAPRQ